MRRLSRGAHPLRSRVAVLWVRLRRLGRSKSVRAVAAALATLVLLTALRAYDPRIVNEIKERAFDAYQRLSPRAVADLPVPQDQQHGVGKRRSNAGAPDDILAEVTKAARAQRGKK